MSFLSALRNWQRLDRLVHVLNETKFTVLFLSYKHIRPAVPIRHLLTAVFCFFKQECPAALCFKLCISIPNIYIWHGFNETVLISCFLLKLSRKSILHSNWVAEQELQILDYIRYQSQFSIIWCPEESWCLSEGFVKWRYADLPFTDNTEPWQSHKLMLTFFQLCKWWCLCMRFCSALINGLSVVPYTSQWSLMVVDTQWSSIWTVFSRDSNTVSVFCEVQRYSFICTFHLYNKADKLSRVLDGKTS